MLKSLVGQWLDNGTDGPKGAGGREFESHRDGFFFFFFKLEITIFFSFLHLSKVITFNSKKKNCHIALLLACHIHGLALRGL